MSKFSKIKRAIFEGKTILGVGPMSKRCIEAICEVATEDDIPIMIVASRRQVETGRFVNSGYVTSTESLRCIVDKLDKKNNVLLCRDHGGPWQGYREGSLSIDDAMQTAMMSYIADIKSGFDILHLDPSLNPGGGNEDVVCHVRELYNFCESVASVYDREIIYEAGTEAHGLSPSNVEEFEDFCVNGLDNLDKVRFVVGNTGLYVKELENIGSVNDAITSRLVNVCDDKGFFLKAHNCDYYRNLNKLHSLGVHSLNVAPEYGTFESRLILKYLEEDIDLKKWFVDCAVDSGHWQKWMKQETLLLSGVDDEYKTAICGHYIFNEIPELQLNKEFNRFVVGELKKMMRGELKQLGWSV